MFIGHFGVAFAAKKVAPETSLGTLILATQFLDFLWPVFLLLGIEHVQIAPGITRVSPLDFTDYPISHSLLMAVVWAIVLGAIYYTVRRNLRSALVVGAAEVFCFGAGLWIYLSCTRARDKGGRYGFWALAAFLFLGWLSTLFAGAPPGVTALAWGGIAMWLVVPWGWWADRHRTIVHST